MCCVVTLGLPLFDLTWVALHRGWRQVAAQLKGL